MEHVGHGIPLKYAALLLTGWRRRHDNAIGGLYEGIARSGDGGCAVFDIRSLLSHAYGQDTCKYGEGSGGYSRCNPARCSARVALQRAGGREKCGVLPMAPVRALARTSALGQCSYDFLHQTDSRFNDDHAIASTMIALQTVLFLLGKAAGPAEARSLTRVCRSLFTRVHDLCDCYPASQAIVNKLRDDPFAEDMLQKALSGILARRPLTQVERLRIVETILKRTYKHHDSLLEGSDPTQGLFAVLSMAPVMVAHGSGILPEDKAVEQVGSRIARMPGLLAEARAGGLRGDGILLHGLANESGLAGTSAYAFARLSMWCREREPRSGTLANLRAAADFGSLGFVGYGSAAGAAAGGGSGGFGSFAAAFPKLGEWIATHVEAAEAPIEPCPASRDGVPSRFAALLLNGWRKTSSPSSAAAGADAAAAARACGGSYDGVQCHEDGSIAVFDIRSLLHHLQGNAYCPVTEPWAAAPSGADPYGDGADAAAAGGAGAAPAAPAAAPASAGRCGARCAARLAVESMETGSSLDSFGVCPLAPGAALARSGALSRLARTLLHVPESAARDAEAQAREAGQDGVAAAALTLQTLLGKLQAARSPQALGSLLRMIQGIMHSVQSLCAAVPAAQATVNRLRDDAHSEDILQKALLGILAGRPISQLDRLRMVEAILKRTYAAGFHSLLDEGAVMCHGSAAAAAAAAAEAAASAVSGSRGGGSAYGGARRSGPSTSYAAARGGAGSGGSSALRGGGSSYAGSRPVPAAPAGRSSVYSAYAAVMLVPTVVAYVAGELAEEEAITRLLNGEERLHEVVTEAKARGLSAEGSFLHGLASSSSFPGTTTFAFSRLADWCKARGSRGELSNLRADAGLSALGFRL